MANGLGEEHGPIVQKVVDDVFNLFAPTAHSEWLPWGGDLLFSDLQEEIEREVREAEAKRWMDEEQAEVERKRVEEEGERRVAAAAKTERLVARRAALNEARQAAMLEFRVKTLSREDLQK
jgi:hypothetical protein